MIKVEELRRMLTKVGFEKTYLIEEAPNCSIYMGIYRDREFIIAVFKGTSSFYAKIIPATLVSTSHWQCNYIKYSPMGWYVFSDSIDDLVKRLGEKILKIIELKFPKQFIT
ncbi:MAG: hypothetical protein N3E36_07050 [Sulfolobales archaeon]|nr:hypothetical protein [Ignisphaera sp.]MCX8199749.1 hypothetical protein [Sulfolobales archaeon]MDW8085013.1 hypothetical protein [Ignisphaera sp.]